MEARLLNNLSTPCSIQQTATANSPLLLTNKNEEGGWGQEDTTYSLSDKRSLIAPVPALTSFAGAPRPLMLLARVLKHARQRYNTIGWVSISRESLKGSGTLIILHSSQVHKHRPEHQTNIPQLERQLYCTLYHLD